MGMNKAVAVGILATVAIVAAACSSSASTGSAQAHGHGQAPSSAVARQAVDAAYTTTIATKSTDFSMTSALSAPSSTLTKSVTISAHGAYDFSTKVGEVTISAPAGGAILGSGKINLRIISNTVYVELPATMSGAIGGKKWIEMSASGLSQLSGAQLGPLSSSIAGDPGQFLSLLRSESDQFSVVGTVELNGRKTTEYRVVVDLSKLPALPAGGAGSAARTSPSSVLGYSQLPVDVWVGEHGHLRQVATTVDLSKVQLPGTSAGKLDLAGATESLRVDFSHFGVPVTVTAPPASEVGTASSIGP